MAKRKMPPHIVLPDGRWRFVKKGHSSHRQTNKSLGGKMAKAKVKYRTKVKKVYAKSRGGGGQFKSFIDGGLAGVIGQVIQRWLGPWGHPVATAGVGYWRKNQTLQTEGARELGALIGSMLPVIGGGSSPYGGGRNY